jgi:hypothetical protein
VVWDEKGKTEFAADLTAMNVCEMSAKLELCTSLPRPRYVRQLRHSLYTFPPLVGLS